MISHSHQSKPPVAWALAFSAMVLAATLFSGCTEPLAPVLPEWDVDANVPIVNHTYTMEDMLRDDGMLRISENGEQLLVVTQRYPLKSIAMGDHLRMEDVTFRSAETFDAVRFELPDYLDQHLDVFTLFPTLPRGSQVVGAVRSDLGISIAIDTREYFEEMTFAAGDLALQFSNNVPVPLRIEAIRLLDTQGSTMAQLSWNELVQPGARAVLPVMKLDGLTLRSDMRLAFDISSPGSNGKAVDLSSAMSLGVTGALRETDILSVRGFVPSQQLQYDRAMNVTGSTGMKIREAVVRSGALRFTVKNHFTVGAQVQFSLLSASHGGAPISASMRVGPKGTATMSLDLADAKLRLDGETDLRYRAEVVTDDATEKAVLIQKSDSVAITGQLRDVLFASMSGTLPPTTLDIRDMEYSDFNLDKSIAGSIQLSEARIWAALRNGSVLPVGISRASVLGKNVSGSSASLRVLPMDLAAQSEIRIDFEETQVVNFLNSFMPEYPDSLGMEGTFVLNPDGADGSAAAGDSVTGDLFVEFPLRFTQVNGSITDTVALLIDETTRSKMNSVNEGTMTFDIENHLPATVRVEPEFLDASGRVLFVPASIDGNPLQVRSAPVDAGGYVRASITEKLSLRFTAEEFARLARATSVRFRLSFTADEGGGAAFRSTDYVRIRGYARLNVSSTITEK
ncbi:MAG: hypothetical protein RRA94_01650 [Bacteroidota bacterium]|nr:hypothetical protein [Bacteroidota bacterium]